MNANTPTDNPPTFSLITPGNSAEGVALTYHNGMLDTTPVVTVFNFICSVSATTIHSSLSPLVRDVVLLLWLTYMFLFLYFSLCCTADCSDELHCCSRCAGALERDRHLAAQLRRAEA